MKKKILFLVLALAMCLGLTIPTVAAGSETYTVTHNGITATVTVTPEPNGKMTIDCTDAGVFTYLHLGDAVANCLYEIDTISINLGPGVVLEESANFEEVLREIKDVGTTVKINYNGTGSSTQPQQPAGATASPTNDKLEVNSNAADPTVYKINGSNYFKIRDVAALLNGTEKQFAVGYDGSKNAVTATTGQGYEKQSGGLAGAAKGGNQSAAVSNDVIYVNGEKITAEVYKIAGSNYFKLRDLGKALDFYVGWSAERGMYIETDKPYSE